MDIIYTDMTKKDYPDVKRLIKEAWFSEYTFSKRMIDKYACGYLYMYLSELDYCKVAKNGEEVVGFIFGRCNKVSLAKRINYKTKLLFLGLSLLFSNAGRRGLKITRITNKTNKALYKNSPVKPTCELVLFIVDSRYRGQSIGSTLEKNFCEYLISQGRDAVYLYTDTYSNYAFYERRGYVRFGEMEVNFNLPEEEGEPLPKYYIYAKELKQKQ